MTVTPVDLLLWVVFPYVTLAVFVVGLIWRYRTDKFGWTSRSSEMYESGLLRWASPLFHVGVLLVLAGHLLGLAVPKTWTAAAGVSEGAYHMLALGGGMVGGIMAVVGIALLIWRRRTTGSVFLATTTSDKVMYLVLAGVILLGFLAVILNQIIPGGHGYDYRETISPWVRSIFLLQPRPDLMVGVPLSFQLHVIAGFLLFAIWPFTRLVHAFSAPLGYATRPYIVYRSRDEGNNALRTPNRGWEPIVAPISLQDSRSTDIQTDKQLMERRR